MEKTIIIASIVVVIAVALFLSWPHIQSGFTHETDLSNAEKNYQNFLTDQKLSDPISDVKIVITKDNRMLYLLTGDNLIENWTIALGSNPTGAKFDARDNRTPVGEYFICSQDRYSKFHLALGITYPGKAEADKARRENLIDDRTFREIYSAYNKHCLPPQDTKLGGGICIQGGGTNYDWTNGSIAVDNDVIETLSFACPIGTPIRIFENFTDWELNTHMPSYK